MSAFTSRTIRTTGRILMAGLMLCLSVADATTEERKRPKPPRRPAPVSSGDVLIIGGGGATLLPTAATDVYQTRLNKFLAADAMGSPRAAFQTAPLDGTGGRIGFSSGGLTGVVKQVSNSLTFTGRALLSAETFSVTADRFANVLDKLDFARGFFTATTLPNGKILLAGGVTATGLPIRKAELYDPATGLISPTGDLQVARAAHSATLLPNGKVLLAGGLTDNAGTLTKTAELYDPALGTFALTGQTAGQFPFAGHTATLVSGCGCSADGKVVLAGGWGKVQFTIGFSLDGLSIYDPGTGTFNNTSLPTLKGDRAFHTASLLPDGKILLAGGFFGQALVNNTKISAGWGGGRDDSELYDPATNTLTCVGGLLGNNCKASLVGARGGHTATTLRTGKILFAGGADIVSKKVVVLGTSSIYNPATNTFSRGPNMATPHAFHTAVLVH